jgi:hypothetical protein
MRALISLALLIPSAFAAGPSSWVTVYNTSNATITNRPVTFPRYFVRGEIAACAQAIHNGVAQSTQTDVRTRWNDGSLRLGDITFVVPSVAAGASYKVFFQSQPCDNSGYLTKTQILDAAAPWAANLGARIVTTNTVSGVSTDQYADLRDMLTAWDGTDGGATGLGVRYWRKGPLVSTLIVEDQSTRSYDFAWAMDKVTFTSTLNVATAIGSPPTVVGSADTVTVSNADGAKLTVSDILKQDDERVQVTSITADTPVAGTTTLGITRGYGATGCTNNYSGGASATTYFGGPLGCPAPHQTFGFSAAWTPNAYILRTATVDSTHKSLHPLFAVTIWTGTPYVKIQAILENDWSDALQTQTFDLSYKTGNPLGSAKFVHPALSEFAYTRIQNTFWVGASFSQTTQMGGYGLPDDLKLDLNLPYMGYSAIVPNYDSAVHVTKSDVTTYDANLWGGFSAAQKDVNGDNAITVNNSGYAGPRAGSYPKEQGQGGQTQMDWIGILPAWVARYLMTMSDPTVTPDLTYPMLFGNATTSGYRPVHIREASTKTYCANSCAGSDATLSAKGLPLSVEARPTFRAQDTSLSLSGVGADAITPIESTLSIDHWGPELAHQPSDAFSAYLLTGDFYWLEEMEFNSARNCQEYGLYGDGFNSHGHYGWECLANTGSERMNSWNLRTLGQLATIMPDNKSAQKAYWLSKVENNIALEEGRQGITTGKYYDGGTSITYDGSPTAIYGWATRLPCPDSYVGHASEHLGCARDSQTNPLGLTIPTAILDGGGRKGVDDTGTVNNSAQTWNQVITSISDNGSGNVRLNHANPGDTSRFHSTPGNAGTVAADFHVFVIYVSDASGPVEGQFIGYGTNASTYVDIATPVNSTTGTASSGSTALTVADGTGLATGQIVVGAGIAGGTTISAVSGTSVTLSAVTTAALSSTPVIFATAVPYNPPYTINTTAAPAPSSRVIWRGVSQNHELDAWYASGNNSPFMFIFQWGVTGYLRDLGFGYDAIAAKIYKPLIHSFANNTSNDGFKQWAIGGEYLSPLFGSAIPIAKLVKSAGVWYSDAITTYGEIVQGIGDPVKLASDYDSSMTGYTNGPNGATPYGVQHLGAMSFAYPYDDGLGTSGAAAWSNAHDVTKADAFVPHQDLIHQGPKWAFAPRLSLAGPSVSTASLPGGTRYAAYSQALGATGGQAPYSWEVYSSSCPWLTISAAGSVGGVPTLPGTCVVTAMVTDANAYAATKSFTFTVTGGSGPRQVQGSMTISGTGTIR